MLSIDGVHIENDLGLHLLASSYETMMPDTREDTLIVPGKHGAYVFDSYLEPRKFFPNILIPSQATLNDVQSIVRKVASLLVDEYGKPKDLKIIYDYEPEKFYIARFTGYISIDRIARAGIFPIPLQAYDPFAYAELSAYDQSLLFDDGNVYDNESLYPNPKEVDLIYNKQFSSVYNYSHIKTSLNLTVHGFVKDLRIKNLTTGDEMSFNVTIKDGEELIIQGNKFSVQFRNERTLSIMSGNFIELISGQNDLVFYSTSPNGKIEYQWNHKFV